MELNYWALYLVLKMDAIALFFWVLFIATSFFLLMHSLENKATVEKWVSKKILGWVAFLCLILSILCPTTKQAAALLILPTVVNNSTVQNVGENALKLSDRWLGEQLKKIEGAIDGN